MDHADLPPAAFADPDGTNQADVEGFAQEALAVALGHLLTASERSPLPDGAPGALGEGALIPEQARPASKLLDEAQDLLAGSMNPAHPGFMGHMDPMPATASVVGDLLAAAANGNMLSREMSRAFSRLEERLTGEIARRFELGAASGGVMTGGGSVANLHALAVARNAAFPDVPDRGLGEKRPVLFASEAAHTSVQKAVMLLGLGTEAVVQVATDESARMNPAALSHKVEAARREGHQPFAVVATAGTTTTGNIDPLPEVARVAEEHGLWLHVDAAYGGALVFSEEHQERLGGIGRADSVTFNPQKWCYVAKTCAMVLFSDWKRAQGVFRVAAPYMKEQEVTNLGEVGVQGTRHADAVKLWLTLRHLGRQGLDQLISESYQLTERFTREVEARPFLELASQPEMNLVCFRGVPEGHSPEEADAWNTNLQAHLLRGAGVFLSLPRFRGRRWLRAVFLNPFTETRHIDQLFSCIDDFVDSHSVGRSNAHV